MPDLKQRFDSLSRTGAPDLWPDIEHREPRPIPPEPRGHRAITAVVALAVAVAGLAFAVIALPRGVERRGPAGASSNGMIAFPVSGFFGEGRQPAQDIFVVNPDGTGLRNLTPDGATYFSPAWSPDGTKIAFVRFEQLAGRRWDEGIYVANADGSDASKVYESGLRIPISLSSVRWSPDGSKIGFVEIARPTGPGPHTEAEAVMRLFVMNVDGTDATPLTGTDGQVTSFSWSPDGGRIVYARQVAGEAGRSISDLYLMNADGSGVRRLTDDGRSLAPSWSPDGTKIAFESYGPSEGYRDRRIYVMNMNSTERVRLTNGPGTDARPVWSPDGTEIAFARFQGDQSCSLMVVSSNGGSPQTVVDGAGVDGCPGTPAWQPLPPAAASAPPAADGLDASYSAPGGWSMSYPSDWHLTDFEHVCRIWATGALVSNVRDAYHSPVSETGCYWPPRMNELPATGVVVEFDLWEGGLGTAPTAGPDTTFPLSFDDLQVQPTPGPGPVRYTERVQVNGNDRYELNVWIGPEASAQDQEIARQIVSSIAFEPSGGQVDIGMTPVPGGELVAVGATSSSDVWAVGEYRTGESFEGHSLVERWDGSAWQTVQVPDVGRLNGVAAISSDDVWAIGGRTILHWDGASWSIVDAPRPPSSGFASISASGPDDVWIAGTRGGRLIGANSRGTATFVEHWDGRSWGIVATPNPSNRHDILKGIVAISPDDAWAAGYSEPKSDHDYTLTLHWDGSTWATVPSPNASNLNVLWGIGTDGAGGVWAVGHYRNEHHLTALVLRWDGSSWHQVSPIGDALWSPTLIGGTAADDVWVVGSGPTSNLAIAHWDGMALNLVVPPATGNQRSIGTLSGLVVVSASDAWVVGVENGSGQDRVEPLIEHWNGVAWETVPSPRL